ncbi:sodium:proton antiporter [Weissella diestrammenae]|uniref:Sodium:proton antiporter n=1 Tax=Weissella diestrammenae TaxID=1162633 RepID=A0A7G9T7Q8_9LACO|nr:Na+/H+ antiporter NhaC family protein [Weissella diestrammenae]MCM0582880.1 sodium:proton antiporter [Weissella diestrammenae]QNN76133.1 sodium:proton antiporter [Weissella diestrammenae]
MENKQIPKLSWAIGLLALLIVIFSGGIIGLGLSPIVPLVTSLLVVVIFSKMRRISWQAIQNDILSGLKTGLAPLFLFLLIGMLIGLWMATNVIPTMLWIGFKISNAAWFLPSALLVTALVGSMIGSAFTTLATVGVALMGVGIALGFNPAVVAGAVLSGAIFGDKSSPLSDSTNLAASIAEEDLFAHIKNLMWTTLPALLGTFIIFLLMGFNHQGGSVSKLTGLANLLHPTWWAIIPLGLLMIMAWLKIPAIPTLLVNIGVSGIAFMTTHHAADLSQTLLEGFKTSSHNPTLMALLNRGGMMSMMPTVIIIMLALALGGLLTEQKILEAVMAPIVKHIKSGAGVVTGTVITGITANFMIGEQYLATILPGQLWKTAYDRVGLSRLALGRALEDSGTVINYLVPWGVAGSFAAQTLGVSVSSFAPYVFFALLSPIFSLLSAWTGIGLKKNKD